MGRVTIFSLEDCGHCRRTKSALSDRGICFLDISLTTHPSRRPDMLSLSDQLSVPQVFFNKTLVGGADETIKLLEEWEKDGKSAKEQFDQEVGAEPDPDDARLQPSIDPPVEPSEPPPRDASDNILLPDGTTSMHVLELTEKLKSILPCEDKKYQLKIYKNCFTPAEAILALQHEFGINEEEAVAFGRSLREAHIINHVLYEHDFSDSNEHFFRLQCHQTPDVLNSYRLWTGRVDTNVMGLIHRLKKMLGQVEAAMTDDKGRVNYKDACKHEKYPEFEEAVCELQKVNLASLDRNTMLAFGINAYNMFILYAFMKVGIGTSDLSRYAFFNSVKFNVGGDLFSFNDWEHGILRGNRKAPVALTAQFGRNDRRLPLILANVDCRIHFALNCGANSCPPVKSFTTEGIQEELRIVAQAFCEDDSNCQIDLDRRCIRLSKILRWYRADFAPSDRELPQKLQEFLRGKKLQILQTMLNVDTFEFPIEILWNTYDWTTNASDFAAFESNALKAEQMSIMALF